MSIFKAVWQKVTTRTSAQKVTYLRKQGCEIGERTTLFCNIGGFGSEPYLVRIGSDCLITIGVSFLTHDGALSVLNHMGLTTDADRFGRVCVGNNVFIGINATVLPGVTIGDNVIIGAGSVVTRDIPEGSVAAGVPARVVGTVGDYYNKHHAEFVQTLRWSAEKKREYLCKNILSDLTGVRMKIGEAHRDGKASCDDV